MGLGSAKLSNPIDPDLGNRPKILDSERLATTS